MRPYGNLELLMMSIKPGGSFMETVLDRFLKIALIGVVTAAAAIVIGSVVAVIR
jgi:hypothetical protein